MGRRCWWPLRWYHASLRQTDLELIGNTLVYISGTPNSAEAAWAEFLRQPGQEHWFCGCAPTDRRLLP